MYKASYRPLDNTYFNFKYIQMHFIYRIRKLILGFCNIGTQLTSCMHSELVICIYYCNKKSQIKHIKLFRYCYQPYHHMLSTHNHYNYCNITLTLTFKKLIKLNTVKTQIENRTTTMN